MIELILVILFVWMFILTVYLATMKRGPRGKTGKQGERGHTSYVSEWEIQEAAIKLPDDAVFMKKLIHSINSMQLEKGEKVNEKLD